MRHLSDAALCLEQMAARPHLMNTLYRTTLVTIDVDHIAELSTHPLNAFNPRNLMFSLERQNRTYHNLLTSMDPFQPTRAYPPGISRAGRLRGDHCCQIPAVLRRTERRYLGAVNCPRFSSLESAFLDANYDTIQAALLIRLSAIHSAPMNLKRRVRLIAWN